MPDMILSDDRLNPLSNLSNEESDGYKLFNDTLVWYLMKIQDEDKMMNLFIETAEDVWLDLLGYIKGLYRLEDEDDDTFRERILVSGNFQLSVDDIKKLNGDVVCYVEDLNRQITSKNDLLSDEFIIDAPKTCKEYINRYVKDGGWHYLNVGDLNGIG